MSDDERGEDSPRSGGGVLGDVFSPGVITRLQYSSYLFIGLVACLILKGTAGHALDSFALFRHGCEYLSTTESGIVHTILNIGGGGGGDGGQLPMPSVKAPESLLSFACFGNTLVYRVSFSLALFFLVHLIAVSDLTCCIEAKIRAQMQERFFSFKTLLLVLLVLLTFTVVPNAFFAGYAWLCMGVSSIFLLVQIILLVDFSYQWNDDWGRRAEETGNQKWQYYLATVAIGSYAVGIICCIISFIYFVPHSDCNFNAFAITAVVIVPGIISTLVAVWVPHGSIVPTGIVFAYCSVMELLTLRATEDPYCNAFPSSQGAGGSDSHSMKGLLISSLVSGAVLAYTVVSSSGDRTQMTLEATEDAAQRDADDDGHLSGYMYFHLVMLMGSMYLAMLATDWTVSGGVGSGDAGNNDVRAFGGRGVTAAFWVKHTSLWLTMATYMWTLLAPYYCCKDRNYGFDTDDW